jgi:hypothetical protein
MQSSVYLQHIRNTKRQLTRRIATRRLAYDLVQGIHGYIEPHAVEGWYRFFPHHLHRGYLLSADCLSICHNPCALLHPTAEEIL